MRSPSESFAESAAGRVQGSGRSVAGLEARNVGGPSRMRRNRATGMLLAAALVVVVVAVDILFFRGGRWFWKRLAANVGIVFVFGTVYFSLPAMRRRG